MNRTGASPMVRSKAAIVSTVVAAVVLACGTARSAIVVFDRVTLSDQPVQLIVLTRGKLFPEGGQLVSVSVGGTRLKQLLTGGDGYGYLMYDPAESGIIGISAEYKNGSDSGTLLVLDPQEQAILVDLDSAARESVLSTGLRQDTRSALESLTKHYRIIYLHGLTGLALARRWLEANRLPPSAVVSWQNADRMKRLARNGVLLHAIIGSTEQMTASENYIRNRFSFEKTDAGRQVESWAEVLKALELEGAIDDD